jgi:hypothetical protein
MGYVKLKDPALEFKKRSNPREGYINGDYRFVPIELIDVAGLVPGAHEGKGLGNQFLNDLSQADALIHVIDLSGSTNEKGEPVNLNSYDPAEDVKFLEEELDHWYHNIIKRNWENIEKKVKMQDIKIEEALGKALSGLKISQDQIEQALSALQLDKTTLTEHLFAFSRRLREINKPMVIAANKCDVLQERDQWKEKLDSLRSQFPQYHIIPVMAEYEWNLKKAAKEGIIDYVPGENMFSINNPGQLNEKQTQGLNHIHSVLEHMETTGVQDCLNSAVFDLLRLKPLFPGGVTKLEDSKGNVLPDCFLLPEQATALDFAYHLHTDFGKNFVQAINVRTKLPVGKDTILQFGDIIEIRSGK